MPHLDLATCSAKELLTSERALDMLDVLADEGLLTPELELLRQEERAIVDALGRVLEQYRDPRKRKRPPATRVLPNEPIEGEPDQLGLFVLAEPYGSQPATVPTQLGLSGMGGTAVRWLWMPPSLAFASRADFAKIRRESSLRDRLVVITPDRIERGTAGFGDIFSLVASSPTAGKHAHDIARAILRGAPLGLLNVFLTNANTMRDAQRSRLVRERIMILERQNGSVVESDGGKQPTKTNDPEAWRARVLSRERVAAE